MGIRIFAELEVYPDCIEQFKQFATEAAKMVKDKEGPGSILYEYVTTGPDCRECIIQEIYADAKALEEHVNHMKAARGTTHLKMFEVKRLAVSGDLPAHLIEHLKMVGGTTAKFYTNRIAAA